MNEEPTQAASSEPSAPDVASSHGTDLQPSAAFAAEQQSSAPGIASVPMQVPGATSPVSAPAPAAVYTAPDRTDVQSIYPEPASTQQSQQLHTGFSSSLPSSSSEAVAEYNKPSTMMWDVLAVLIGFGSAIGFIGLTYVIKSVAVPVVICAILAAAAIFFAIKSYQIKQQLNPMVIIGISAATYTLIYVITIAFSQIMISSSLGSSY